MIGARLLLIAILALLILFILPLALVGGRGEAWFGGLVLIGPFPIIFSSKDPATAIPAMLAALLIPILFLILAARISRRAAES
ncbi:MAG: DUF131 domain-containing protein [Aigarchaeota archaeon]|nr:DUF131 domain-containing protein [Candidatus Pelearchaeum maunauluense]